MSRISVKNSAIKLQIQINEQVKFGKIAYRPQDLISKVFHDLKRIKILPGVVDEDKVKYYDKDNCQLSSTQEFAQRFDLTQVNHLIKLSIPDRSIDIEETTRRADEYIRTNKEKKSKLREMSEAEGLVKNLKPMFAAISEENYNQLGNLCDNQEYLTILQEYVEEHKHLVNLVRVYERVIESTLENRDISLNTLAAINQIKDNSKEKVEAWVRRLNNAKKDERIRGQHWQAREEQLKAQNNSLKEALERQTQSTHELEVQYQNSKAMFDQFQRDMDGKILEYEKTINNLQLENTNIENRYEKVVERLREVEDEGLKGGQSNLEKIQFIRHIADKDIILHELAVNPKHCHSLMEKLKDCLPSFMSLKLLYKHSKHYQCSAFHRMVDLQQNILLVAKTRQGRIFGGFTTLPFDPSHRKHSPPGVLNDLKAFIFTLHKDEVCFFSVKEGMDSVEYDQDYVIFGNAEICIDKQKWRVDSQFVSHKQQYLHYNDPHQLRTCFLSDKKEDDDMEDSAELLGYEIYQAALL